MLISLSPCRCGQREAVFFQSQSRKADVRVCVQCYCNIVMAKGHDSQSKKTGGGLGMRLFSSIFLYIFSILVSVLGGWQLMPCVGGVCLLNGTAH